MNGQMASQAGQFSVSFLDLLLLAGNVMRNSSGQQTLITSPEEQKASNRLKGGKTDGAQMVLFTQGSVTATILFSTFRGPIVGALHRGDSRKVTSGLSLAFFHSEP